ncbi:MAG: hypothetical protein Q8R13_00070 [bacterium]|nr:hypothetical protein [bacterium]MDZ4295875.1 hypothetical protein [Patescibacteria group bacterium]
MKKTLLAVTKGLAIGDVLAWTAPTLSFRTVRTVAHDHLQETLHIYQPPPKRDGAPVRRPSSF